MTLVISFSLMLFFLGMSSFAWNQKHILSLLLSMEIMVMGIFFFFIPLISNLNMEILMFYLILVICESCLGLSILINITNYYSSDLFKSSNILNF